MCNYQACTSERQLCLPPRKMPCALPAHASPNILSLPRPTHAPQVEDPPGTYLWHDHAAGFKGDGLQGPLLVLPPRAPPAVGKQPAFGDAHVPDLWSYDGEHVVFISDWWVH